MKIRFSLAIVAPVIVGTLAFVAGKHSPFSSPGASDEPTGAAEPVFLISAETPQNSDMETLGAILFDAHHSEAVKIFEEQPGQGFSRIMPLLHHDLKNRGMQPQKSIFEQHDFTFIGNDSHAREAKNFKENTVGSAIFFSPGKDVSQMKKPDSIDEMALYAFEKNPELQREFHRDGNQLVGYGPLRAAESCAKCHGVEEGTLLGAFRYRFDLPNDVSPRELAAVFSRQ